jgi:hypothetical protein
VPVILDPLRLLGGPLLAAVMGDLIVHFATRRRDAENERRKQRIDYLLKAYRTLAHLAIGRCHWSKRGFRKRIVGCGLAW